MGPATRVAESAVWEEAARFIKGLEEKVQLLSETLGKAPSPIAQSTSEVPPKGMYRYPSVC